MTLDYNKVYQTNDGTTVKLFNKRLSGKHTFIECDTEVHVLLAKRDWSVGAKLQKQRLIISEPLEDKLTPVNTI